MASGVPTSGLKDLGHKHVAESRGQAGTSKDVRLISSPRDSRAGKSSSVDSRRSGSPDRSLSQSPERPPDKNQLRSDKVADLKDKVNAIVAHRARSLSPHASDSRGYSRSPRPKCAKRRARSRSFSVAQSRSRSRECESSKDRKRRSPSSSSESISPVFKR